MYGPLGEFECGIEWEGEASDWLKRRKTIRFAILYKKKYNKKGSHASGGRESHEKQGF